MNVSSINFNLKVDHLGPENEVNQKYEKVLFLELYCSCECDKS